MIALRKEVFEKIKTEMLYLGIIFLVLLTALKIAFYKENLFVIFRSALALFWLFGLPGFSIMLYWHDKIEFLGRFIFGIALSAAVIGISSYYIGLFGLNIKYHVVLLPVLMITLGILAALRRP